MTYHGKRSKLGFVETPSMRVIRRFWEHTTVGAPDACWLWSGPVTTAGGYGYLHDSDGALIYAHRLAMLIGGRDPFGHVVHHLCETQLCVNPAHLEALTQSDHRRKHYKGCKHHGFEDVRVYRNGRRAGQRYCGVCNLERARQSTERRKQAA